MKVIELVRVPGEVRVDTSLIPDAIVNAIHRQRELYPDVLNYSQTKDFDRLFEQLNKCRVEYGTRGEDQPDRIIWPNDRDYTLFLIRWSSV